MLVDTSVWVDHLRRGHAALVSRLHDGLVSTHPFVIGELACGNLRNRSEVLDLFASLPTVPIAAHDAVLAFVNDHHLMGRGLGWVDVHLLAAATLASVPLWTSDKRLAAIALELGVGRLS